MKLYLLIMALFAVTICYSQEIDGFNFEPYPFRIDLNYEEIYTKKIRTSSDLNTETLSFHDKLNFKRKKYVKNHHKYLDQVSNLVHDIAFVSHENMFPKWYVHPSLIRIDSLGTTSYFSTPNSYLPDGWEGGQNLEIEYGEYSIDPISGEKTLYLPHTTTSQQAYDNSKEETSNFGVLQRLVWNYPTSITLSQLEQDGSTVITNSEELKVENSNYQVIWNLNQKTFTRRFFEDGTLVKTTHTVYSYDSVIGANLKIKDILIVPKTFSNGDCYEEIHTTVFTEYNADRTEILNGPRFQNRETNTISVYPNPTSDILNINLSCSDCRGANITIMDTSGAIFMMRKFNDFSGQINVRDLPSGLYIAELITNGKRNSIKFIKE